MRACVFPGQGAQFIGMGEGLFERYPGMTAEADEILGYSVKELCLGDSNGRLHQTQYTQPALYVVNALTYRSRCDDGLPPPDFLAGHSLGEYNALWAAGVFDFETGLRLVQRRGDLMSRASGGAMAAVIGCSWERAEEILRRNGLAGIDLANDNTPFQVVLSGPAEDIARAEPLFSEIGATCVPLKNVSAAFHSRYMEPLAEPLGEMLDGVNLRDPKIPVISNVSARPHRPGEVKDHLRRQIREPVRWTGSIQYLLGEGVEEFEEVGPGGVLTKLIKAIRRQSAPAPVAAGALTAERLGSGSFRRDYNVRRAYVAGSIGPGITSADLVIRMGRAGYLGFFGADGLAVSVLDEGLRRIKSSLGAGEPFGVSLRSSPDDPEAEMAVVDLCLRHGVRVIEATGFVVPSPALVRYRLKGKVIAKVSRPEVAEAFLNPPPEPVVAELLKAGLISAEEARRAARIPMADDICVDGESPGQADLGGTAILLPLMIRRRDEVCRGLGYGIGVRIGASGIGTPESAAAAFLLGADFVLAGSIHQCTVEAGTSDEVKEILQTVDVQDTESAPAGDLFELGGRVQVLKKGVLFPARANRLHDLWRHHGSWEEIDAPTRAKIERDCLGRSFESVYEELRRNSPAAEIEKAERDARYRMALVFRWYFERSMRLALAGEKGQRANYQVHCGPALGAFNQWVKGTPLEPWRQRHVDAVADRIMEGAAEALGRQLQRFVA
jgi:trans-AT polyketide synthase/acyltransferase/oxidoreductase domain-containing protein